MITVNSFHLKTLFFLLLFSTSVFTSNIEQWITQEIKVEDGLPDSTVFSIQQDNSGFMWFGTTNGLARYDGYTFKVFSHDGADENTISNNNAGNIFIDSKNTLWIGTFGGGVNTLNLNSGELFKYPYSRKASSKHISENVQTFYEDEKNNIWIGTANGLYKLNYGNITHYNHDKKNPNSLIHSRVWSITGSQNGDLWIGTSEGLTQLNPKTDKISNYKLPIDIITDISSNQFRTLFFLNDTLWIGSSTGLYSFNSHSKNFKIHTPIHNMKINDIKSIGNGQLLIASKEGIFQFDMEKNQFRSNPDGSNWQALSHLDIRSILIDKSGLLWLATRDNGVIKVDQLGGLFQHHKTLKIENTSSEQKNQIWSLDFNANQKLLLGTSKALYKQLNENEFTKITTKESNSIPGIIRDTKTSLNNGTWVGSSEGLFFLEQDSLIAKKVTEPFDLVGIKPADIFSIEEAHNGEIWLALYNVGVLRWQPNSSKATLIQSFAGGLLTDINITHVYQDSDNNIWIGSSLIGAFKFDVKTEELTHFYHDYNNNYSLSSNRIKDIFQDSKNRLWFATFRGLNLYNTKNNTFTHYMESDGLLDNSINAILEDSKQNLWLTYKFGISRFTPENHKINNYKLNPEIKNDGFITRSATIDANDTLFLGSTDGYFTFDPEDISENNVFQPTFKITDILINNHSIPFSELNIGNHKYNLHAEENVISFHFASLDHKISDQIQYSYKIQGLHDEWLDVTPTRNIVLNNFKPGNYAIQIRAANNDGRWTEQTLDLDLTVHPDWWNMSWVRLMFVIMIALLALILHIYRTYKIRQLNEILEAKVSKRTKELVQLNKKLKLASQTDFLTGLYNRSGFIKYFKKKNSANYTIVVSDVDNFKMINDLYSHSAGDSILKSITKIMKSKLSDDDLIARWGGEEFIFYFANKDAKSTYTIIECIRLEIQNSNIIFNDKIVPVTCTFGICNRKEKMELNECIDAADDAMYKGKEQGRNMSIISSS